MLLARRKTVPPNRQKREVIGADRVDKSLFGAEQARLVAPGQAHWPEARLTSSCGVGRGRSRSRGRHLSDKRSETSGKQQSRADSRPTASERPRRSCDDSSSRSSKKHTHRQERGGPRSGNKKSPQKQSRKHSSRSGNISPGSTKRTQKRANGRGVAKTEEDEIGAIAKIQPFAKTHFSTPGNGMFGAYRKHIKSELKEVALAEEPFLDFERDFLAVPRGGSFDNDEDEASDVDRPAALLDADQVSQNDPDHNRNTPSEEHEASPFQVPAQQQQQQLHQQQQQQLQLQQQQQHQQQQQLQQQHQQHQQEHQQQQQQRRPLQRENSQRCATDSLFRSESRMAGHISSGVSRLRGVFGGQASPVAGQRGESGVATWEAYGDEVRNCKVFRERDDRHLRGQPTRHARQKELFSDSEVSDIAPCDGWGPSTRAMLPLEDWKGEDDLNIFL